MEPDDPCSVLPLHGWVLGWYRNPVFLAEKKLKWNYMSITFFQFKQIIWSLWVNWGWIHLLNKAKNDRNKRISLLANQTRHRPQMHAVEYLRMSQRRTYCMRGRNFTHACVCLLLLFSPSCFFVFNLLFDTFIYSIVRSVVRNPICKSTESLK